jgi:hypothetical protein
MTDQAVETAKEIGKQDAEDAIEKLPEEVQQAIDVAKEVTAEETPKAAEEMMKEEAVQEGMKLPGKE